MTNELIKGITGEEFLEVFIREEVISDLKITSNFVFNSKNIEAIDFNGKRRINNCVFEKNVGFENFETNLAFTFDTCSFLGNIVFKNCQNSLNDIRIWNSECKNIEIKDCEIDGFVITNPDKMEFVSDQIFIMQCNVNNLFIRNVKFKYVEIGTSKTKKSFVRNLRLESSDVLENFYFDNVEVDNFVLEKGIFDNSWVFNETVTIGILKFLDATVNQEIFLDKEDNIRNIRIEGGVFKNQFVIENTKSRRNLDRVYLFKCKFEKDFHIGNVEVKYLEITTYSVLEGNYTFIDSIISSLILRGTDNKACLTFQNCAFRNLEFYHFRTNEDLFFNDIKSCEGESEIKILGSRLSKTLFSDVSFKSFNKITIKNSMIQDINTVGVEWFSDKQLNILENKKAEDWKKDREVFRQIKQSLEKQGSNIDALTFKAYEMSAYKKERSGKTKNGFEKIKHFFKDFGNNLILVAGWANDFGLSWTRALGLAILSCILFFVILSFTLMPEMCFYFSTNPSDLMYIDSFPNLFNPVLSLDKVFVDKKIEIGFWSNLVFLFHRIVLSFFIFQIISAFRKYVK